MKYRSSLRSFQLRQGDETVDTSSNSKTNERWMTSQELKGKIKSLKQEWKATAAKLKRTEKRLADLIDDESIEVRIPDHMFLHAL